MKTYIVLDESGAMHLKDERYFVIGGYVTKELHKVISTHKKIEKDIKIIKHIPIKENVELKSSKISSKEQSVFLNGLYNLKSITPIAIIVDKENLNKFEASENVAYNFFVKNLIKYLLTCHLDLLDTESIELRVDNRNVGVKKLKDLETFLEWEFNLNNLEFSVKYLDSKNHRDVQMADYVANLMWKKYNKVGETLSSKINLFYRIFLSRFPYKLFGKNPSLKKLNEKSID